MYRKTKNNTEDIKNIIDIYNEITNKNRTVEQHQWEWFGSSYKNKSYVITSGNEIIGHHGVLSDGFDYKGKRHRMGKTKNKIIKNGLVLFTKK